MKVPVPGTIIAQRYRLERQLGAGGMGSVWVAQHLELSSAVAVKLLHGGLNDPSMHQRFVAEAKAAAALRSPHVVQVLDHGFDDGVPFIVMEKLEGQSLGERLRASGPLGLDETVTVLVHVTRAISKAHEAGIVHRDLKPDNIFLHQNDDEFVAKVLDFGIAKVQPDALTNASPNTHTGMLLGSPFYMSPEQAEGRRDVDWRTDLWALGVIVYECLTGHNPYVEETLGKILVKIIKEEVPVPSTVAAVPVGFDDWFARANQKDRALRFQSAREMTEALRALKGAPLTRSSAPVGLPSTNPELVAPARTTTSGTSSPVAGQGTSPKRAGVYLALAAAMALALGGAWWALRARGADSAAQAAQAAQPEPAKPAQPAALAPTPAAAPPPLPAANADAAGAGTVSDKPIASAAAPASPPIVVKLAPKAAAAKGKALAESAKPAPAAPAPAPAPAAPAPAPASAPFNPLQQRF